jgi:hypothetical protein
MKQNVSLEEAKQWQYQSFKLVYGHRYSTDRNKYSSLCGITTDIQHKVRRPEKTWIQMESCGWTERIRKKVLN